MTKNPDILYGLGQHKTHQVLVGFAAETTNVIEYGTKKLQKKNLDMLVANDVSAEGAGFQGTTNIATLLFPDGSSEKLEKMAKDELASIIVARAAAIIDAKNFQIKGILKDHFDSCDAQSVGVVFLLLPHIIHSSYTKKCVLLVLNILCYTKIVKI